MKIWKQLLALLLSGAMALSLFACGSGDAGPSASPDASASPDPAASADPEASATPAIVADLSQGALEFSAGMKPGDVLLTVNGIEIPADLFLYLLGMNCVNIQSYLPLFNMTLEDVADSLLEETVSLASYHALLRQKAGELGCLPTDAQNEEIDKTMEESDLDTTAAYWQLSDDSARYIVAMNTYYNNVLEAATQAPTEEELNDYIAAHEIYRVKHILLKTVDDNRDPLPDDQVAEKKAQAEDLLAQLQGAEDLPAKFDELMMAHSEDNPQNNPDGYLSKPGDMVAAFESASLAAAAPHRRGQGPVRVAVPPRRPGGPDGPVVGVGGRGPVGGAERSGRGRVLQPAGRLPGRHVGEAGPRGERPGGERRRGMSPPPPAVDRT